eukprot:331161-Chlamydomonas_euryale.AAC.6
MRLGIHLSGLGPSWGSVHQGGYLRHCGVGRCVSVCPCAGAAAAVPQSPMSRGHVIRGRVHVVEVVVMMEITSSELVWRWMKLPSSCSTTARL